MAADGIAAIQGAGNFAYADVAVGQLYGREHELGVLTDMAGRLGEGAGGALVVRGEPGIGKSALLAAAAAQARDSGVRVLSAVGVQSESRLPFAGLHQLMRPVLDLARRLPERQRAALLSAFGMSDQAPAELFLIGLATLELISDMTEGSPVLLVADDAQWLDEPSCSVLAFVARRLAAEPAVLLIAERDGLPSPFGDGLPGLQVARLADSAARALLDSRAPGLEPTLRERLLAAAAGNPLALVELPQAVRAEQLAVGSLMAPRLPLTSRLERAFAEQGSGLPAATRSALLAAAADEGSALTEVLAAASVLESAAVTADALVPAVAARLVEIHETRLWFRHPLMRSAIYQASGVSARRAAHAALAGLLADQPDRRAWHRAAAALGPDEAVAADLDAAYAKPLVAADRDAESLYQAALGQSLANWPAYRGRMLLLYGVWLRRQRRAADSRAPLRAARDSLDALGFTGLAEHARRELRAAGESSSRRVPEAWDQLTPQEQQIARMAADGMSNREIGQRLYISHRTVGAHLLRIFPKLDVTSRGQLHAAISGMAGQ
jgi:DNA-binding CsgD family transcriptional regulator